MRIFGPIAKIRLKTSTITTLTKTGKLSSTLKHAVMD